MVAVIVNIPGADQKKKRNKKNNLQCLLGEFIDNFQKSNHVVNLENGAIFNYKFAFS